MPFGAPHGNKGRPKPPASGRKRQSDENGPNLTGQSVHSLREAIALLKQQLNKYRDQDAHIAAQAASLQAKDAQLHRLRVRGCQHQVV